MADTTAPPVPQDKAEKADKTAQVSYFGFGGTNRHIFPDGMSWVEISVMNEGQRRAFQSKTTRDMKVSSGGDATFSMDAGGDRHALLMVAIKGWNLIDDLDNEVPFIRSNLENFLNSADPAVIDDIDAAVRLINPWLISEQSVEEMRAEIDRLEERIRAAEVVEEGK